MIKGVRESTLSVGKSRARNPTQNPTQKPTPNRPYALTSFFHSVVTCSFCKKLYLFSVPTFIVCVRVNSNSDRSRVWPCCIVICVEPERAR